MRGISCRVSSSVLFNIPLQTFCSSLLPSINVTPSSNWFLIAVPYFPMKTDCLNVSDIPVTNRFCWSLYVSLLSTERLENYLGIQKLKLIGSQRKDTGNCSPFELSSGQLEQWYEMHQAKGRVQPLEPSQPLQKLMPFPWRPRKAAAWQWCLHQHCVSLSAYWPRQFPVLHKPKAIPGSTFPVWQTMPTGGRGMTTAQWHYRQTCRCQWVFTGGNAMMGEGTSCHWRQQVREALEVLHIYLQDQLLPHTLFWL